MPYLCFLCIDGSAISVTQCWYVVLFPGSLMLVLSVTFFHSQVHLGPAGDGLFYWMVNSGNATTHRIFIVS